MNMLKQVLLGGGLLLTAATIQAVEISGNVTLATDYVYRGESQTNEEPAIQGGFEVAADSGLYAGVWASNIGFDGSVEIDYFIGFSNEVFEGFSYDIGLIHYDYPNQDALIPVGAPTLAQFIADVNDYPADLEAALVAVAPTDTADARNDVNDALYLKLFGTETVPADVLNLSELIGEVEKYPANLLAAITAAADTPAAAAAAAAAVNQAFYDVVFGVPAANSDFEEIYIKVKYKAFTLGVAFTDNYFRDADNATYVYGEYELSLPSDFSLVLHYGSLGLADLRGQDEYSISLSKEVADIDFSLSWHDTDINGFDTFSQRTVFAMSKTF